MQVDGVSGVGVARVSVARGGQNALAELRKAFELSRDGQIDGATSSLPATHKPETAADAAAHGPAMDADA